MVVLGLVSTGCPPPGPSAPVADSTGGDACNDPPVTAGGEHGAPWGDIDDGMVDDTGEPRLDVGVLPDPEDPTAWESSTAGGQTVYYRSPTSTEMSAYGWTSGHLLVIPSSTFTNAVTGGSSTALAVLPIHDISQSRPQQDLEIASVGLTRQWSHDRIPFYRKTYNGTSVSTTVTHPTLSFYLPTGIGWEAIPERTIAVMASSQTAIEIHGGTRWEQVRMRGPYSPTTGPFDLDIALPTGTRFYVMHTRHEDWTAASVTGGVQEELAVSFARTSPALGLTAEPEQASAASGKCADGLDNDPDGYADDCDYNCVVHEDYGGAVFDHTRTNEYSKDFGLFGDLPFCTCEAPGVLAHTAMTMFAVEASSILNNLQPPAPYEPEIRTPPFRLVMNSCIGTVSSSTPEAACDIATACHNLGGANCPMGLGYPLAGDGNDYDDMLESLWDAVDGVIATTSVADRHPMHLAGIVTTSTSNNSEAGKSLGLDLDVPAINGAFVFWSGDFAGEPGPTIAHEIGHCLGLGHDDALWEDTGIRGFMAGGVAPVLEWDEDSNIVGQKQGQMWRAVSSKSFPRASGFGFTGCDPEDEMACQTGHPGLECNDNLVCAPAP